MALFLWVLSIAFLATARGFDHSASLQQLINNIRNETKAVLAENKQLLQEDERLTKEHMNTMQSLDLTRESTDAEIQEQMEILRSLKLNLSVLTAEDTRLSGDIAALKSCVEKLQLGIEFYEQDISTLQLRRKNQQDKLCSKLNTVPVNARLRSLDEHELVVLENELRQAKTGLFYAKAKNDEIKQKMKLNDGFWKSQLENLKVTIQASKGDLQSVKDAIERFREEYAALRKKVEGLNVTLLELRKTKADKESAAKEKVVSLRNFEADTKCYERLENEIICSK